MFPHHAGGSQRDAVGAVDLAAGGLDRGVQQLLLGGILSVLLGNRPDLDDIQAGGRPRPMLRTTAASPRMLHTRRVRPLSRSGSAGRTR